MSDKEAIELLTRLCSEQADIIAAQSGAVDTLFQLLSQHISAAEMEALPVMDDISRAAKAIARLEGR